MLWGLLIMHLTLFILYGYFPSILEARLRAIRPNCTLEKEILMNGLPAREFPKPAYAGRV